MVVIKIVSFERDHRDLLIKFILNIKLYKLKSVQILVQLIQMCKFSTFGVSLKNFVYLWKCWFKLNVNFASIERILVQMCKF